MNLYNQIIGALATVSVISCSTHQPIVQTQSPVTPIEQIKPLQKRVLKRKVAIARFSNETQYAKGIFYDKKNDPMGKQANDILTTKLASTEKFILLERDGLEKILEEIKIGNGNYQKIGADYIILGSITEFGRKTVGDVNAFSRSKKQVVEAGVSLRLIDVSTGQIIYSEEAKGQAETATKTVMGFGEKADYDATLNDKAISAAISQLVENITNNCMDRPWKSYFIAKDQGQLLIAGGKTQGIKSGDTFEVFEKGRKIKNPQTGIMMTLPGKKVGKITVETTAGDTPENEFSIVSVDNGSINDDKLVDYIIKEIK